MNRAQLREAAHLIGVLVADAIPQAADVFAVLVAVVAGRDPRDVLLERRYPGRAS